MCIFTGPIHPIVSGTRILVAMLAMHLQLVVYQNDVACVGNVAMILPVPGAHVWPINVSSYTGLFDDLDRDIPYDDRPLTLSSSSKNEPPPRRLAIQRVGSYDVSIATSLVDLEALDWTHFALTPEVLALLNVHYARNFSFVVARLRAGAAPHAIAYVHDALADNTLWVPTRHGGHANEDGEHAHFDHSIYAYAQQIDLGLTLTGAKMSNRHFSMVREMLGWRECNATALYYTNLYRLQCAIYAGMGHGDAKMLNAAVGRIYRHDIHGVAKNEDLTFAVQVAPPAAFSAELPPLPIAEMRLVYAGAIVTVLVILVGYFCSPSIRFWYGIAA